MASQSAFFLTKVCREDKKQLFVIYLAFRRSNFLGSVESKSCEILQGSERRRIKSSEDETVWAILSNSPQELTNCYEHFYFHCVA